MSEIRRKRTVMVVDDDESLLAEIIDLLDSNGYGTVVVSDPMVAADTAERVRPSVILLDLKMPGKSGLEVAYEIGKKPQCCHIPIIAMSGFLSSGAVPLIELCGIRKYLKKPINPTELIQTIEKESLAVPEEGVPQPF